MLNAKSIVSDMLAGIRLDGPNSYDQWHYKIKYLLSKNDLIVFITEEVKPLSGKSDVELKRHSNNVKKDRRYLMLSCMADYLIHLYKYLPSAKVKWDLCRKITGFCME